MGGGFAHTHTPPDCCRTPPAPPAASPPVPTPRYHSILGTAPRSSLRKSRLGERYLPTATEGRGWNLGEKAPTSPRTPVGSTGYSGCSGPSEPHRAGATITHPAHSGPWSLGVLDRLRPASPCHRDTRDAQGGDRDPLPASPAPCPRSLQLRSPPRYGIAGTASLPSTTQHYTTGRGGTRHPVAPRHPPPSPGHVLL